MLIAVRLALRGLLWGALGKSDKNSSTNNHPGPELIKLYAGWKSSPSRRLPQEWIAQKLPQR